MRSVLATIAVVVSLAGVWLAGTSRTVAPTSEAQSESAVESQPAGSIRRLTDVEVTATTSEPTPLPLDPKVLTSRENLIARAMGRARAMGEQNPVVKEVQLTSVGEVARLRAGTDQSAVEQQIENFGGDANRSVYVVQIEGSFMPPRLPAGVKVTPRESTLLVVYDATTGLVLSTSF